MNTVIVAMILALLLALLVVALVAIPARREGREVLTPQGEQLVQQARHRTTDAAVAARDKTVEVAEAARGHIADRRTDAAEEPAEIDLREQRARSRD